MRIKGLSKDKYVVVGPSNNRHGVSPEMVVKATINGLNISEVPTKLLPMVAPKNHLNTWRDGWRHLRFLLPYSPKWLFLYPRNVSQRDWYRDDDFSHTESNAKRR